MRKLTFFKSLFGVTALGASLMASASSHAALVAYYPLDGNFNDVVGGFNGAGVNGPSFAASPLGQAVVLNGSNQYAVLTTGANLQLGGNFTVSAHVNFDVLGGGSGDRPILGNDGPGVSNNTLHLTARNTGLHMGFYANDTGPSGTLTTGNWTHVAWQFENDTQRLFIDGVQVGSGTPKNAFAGTNRNVLLGRWHDDRMFDGQIDDVAVYNTALAPADLIHLAQGGSATKLLSESVLDLPLGWNSETFKRPGNATISASESGNGFGGAGDVLDALNNGTIIGSGVVNTVNYHEPGGLGGTGNFGGDVEPFGLSAGADDDFVVRSTGFLQVGLDGNYQFRNNTDDGSRLRLDLNQNGVFDLNETIILDDVLSGPHDADSSVLALLKGQYMIEHVWFERGGGAEGDLGIARNGGAFLLFGNPEVGGDTAFRNYGVYVTQSQIVPEPATLSLIGLAGLGLLRRRRRIA